MKIKLKIVALAIVAVGGVSALSMHLSSSNASAMDPTTAPTIEVVAQVDGSFDSESDIDVPENVVDDPCDVESQAPLTPPVIEQPTEEPTEQPTTPTPMVPDQVIESTGGNIDAPLDDCKTTECEHFWRREYYPETDTEEGQLIDSCLYCGEWYVYQIIAPYGET